jgi:hypothetical protein
MLVWYQAVQIAGVAVRPTRYSGRRRLRRGRRRVDSLHVSRSVAGLPNNAGCLVNVNVKCDDGMTSVDAVMILRHVARLPNTTPDRCPAAGTIVAASAFR